jgi:hypothetical protein
MPEAGTREQVTGLLPIGQTVEKLGVLRVFSGYPFFIVLDNVLNASHTSANFGVILLVKAMRRTGLH